MELIHVSQSQEKESKVLMKNIIKARRSSLWSVWQFCLSSLLHWLKSGLDPWGPVMSLQKV